MKKFFNRIKSNKLKTVIISAIATAIFATGCGANSSSTYIDQGYSAVATQNYTQALDFFDQAILSGENMEMIYRGRGLTFMGAGQYEKAISAFQTALSNADMFPGDLEYDINYYMAVCYFKLDQYNEAIDVYDAIVELRPKDAEAYYLRGNMKLYVNDLEGAIADFDMAVSFNKKNYSIYMDIYEAMVNHGYQDAANQYLDVVLTADADDISSYDKGRLCYYQKDYTRACTYLETARQTEGKVDADLVILLGECYKLVDNYSFAAVIYSTYLESVKDPAIYNQLGLCYVEQEDYERALNAFEQGIAIQENNTCLQTLKLNEIACYEKLHNFGTAKEKLSEYMAMYPGNDVISKEMTFLSTR